MKKVIVLSGVSGSGKSFFAAKIMREMRERDKTGYEEYSKVSADDYFTDENGRYIFNAAMLGEAHNECFRAFLWDMQQDKNNLIIVDNTNCSNEEIAPYMRAGRAFGYDCEIMTVVTENLAACAARNSHGVPLSSIQEQYKRLINRKLLPWWKSSEVSFS